MSYRLVCADDLGHADVHEPGDVECFDRLEEEPVPPEPGGALPVTPEEVGHSPLGFL